MKKQRTQYNWKFKENESPQFYEWFENQDNISSSLRSLIYHVIEIYGTQDVLEPVIQKQLVKDSLILELVKGKNVIQIDTQSLGFDKGNVTHEEKIVPVASDEKDVLEIVSDEKTIKEVENTNITKSVKNTSNDDNSIYGEIDPDTL